MRGRMEAKTGVCGIIAAALLSVGVAQSQQSIVADAVGDCDDGNISKLCLMSVGSNGIVTIKQTYTGFTGTMPGGLVKPVEDQNYLILFGRTDSFASAPNQETILVVDKTTSNIIGSVPVPAHSNAGVIYNIRACSVSSPGSLRLVCAYASPYSSIIEIVGLDLQIPGFSVNISSVQLAAGQYLAANTPVANILLNPSIGTLMIEVNNGSPLSNNKSLILDTLAGSSPLSISLPPGISEGRYTGVAGTDLVLAAIDAGAGGQFLFSFAERINQAGSPVLDNLTLLANLPAPFSSINYSQGKLFLSNSGYVGSPSLISFDSSTTTLTTVQNINNWPVNYASTQYAVNPYFIVAP